MLWPTTSHPIFSPRGWYRMSALSLLPPSLLPPFHDSFFPPSTVPPSFLPLGQPSVGLLAFTCEHLRALALAVVPKTTSKQKTWRPRLTPAPTPAAHLRFCYCSPLRNIQTCAPYMSSGRCMQYTITLILERWNHVFLQALR